MVRALPMLLFIILFLHQTTTEFDGLGYQAGCLSSCSYIKPQQKKRIMIVKSVVYHLVPTSNHNGSVCFWQVWSLFIILFLHQTTTKSIAKQFGTWLFIILFLHQTTTEDPQFRTGHRLFIILFLHQTTTQQGLLKIRQSCLSSCSYIKPQQGFPSVLHLFSCLSSCSYIKPQRLPSILLG